MFINLHGYSTFSFLEAIGKPKDIVKKAKALGQSAIALTDLNVVYGAIQHYQVARDEGIKPIIGTEIGFTLDLNASASMKTIGSICLLAHNSQGYLNLLKLVSYASQEGITMRPKITPQVLEENKEGILAFCGGVDSRIAKMLLNGESIAKIQEIVMMLKNILGEEYIYLEIIAQDEKKHPEIAKINAAVLELAELTDTPCIISNIYSYPEQKDIKTQELAMAIKDNLKLYDPQHRVPTTANHIMDEAEIRALGLANGYSREQLDLWIANTAHIAEHSELTIEMGQALFPKYEGDAAIRELYAANRDQLIVPVE